MRTENRCLAFVFVLPALGLSVALGGCESVKLSDCRYELSQGNSPTLVRQDSNLSLLRARLKKKRFIEATAGSIQVFYETLATPVKEPLPTAVATQERGEGMKTRIDQAQVLTVGFRCETKVSISIDGTAIRSLHETSFIHARPIRQGGVIYSDRSGLHYSKFAYQERSPLFCQKTFDEQLQKHLKDIPRCKLDRG